MPTKKTHSKEELFLKTTKNKMVALNFRVSADFKKKFKIAAVTHGITQSDLLQQAFDEWQKNYVNHSS
jgi:hypothetical protein